MIIIVWVVLSYLQVFSAGVRTKWVWDGGGEVVSVGCGDYLGYAFVMLIAGGELALALSGVLFIAKYRASW